MNNPVLSEINQTGFNLRLGNALFSDPQRDRDNSVVIANHADTVVGVSAGDLLLVDFTDTQLIEGLYIITLDDDWIGYRFFHRMPTLHMRDGIGDYPVSPDMLESIKVVGKIKDIYRTVNKG